MGPARLVLSNHGTACCRAFPNGFMNYPNRNTLPLHLLLRRRRQELNLNQADLAKALHVTPEAVGYWECARRHMELERLPALAEILGLEKRRLCLLALSEFHPGFYAELFGDHRPGTPETCKPARRDHANGDSNGAGPG